MKKLKDKIFGKTVMIYMKSGNVIRLNHIQEISIKTNHSGISYLSITKNWLHTHLSNQKLIVASVDLSQIEAITYS